MPRRGKIDRVVPLELVTQIASLMDAGEDLLSRLKAAIPCVCTGRGLCACDSVTATAAAERTNVPKYLSQLTSTPETLLNIMEDSKTILSGSRAAGFFYPQATTTTSDWDFYTIGCSQSILSFMSLTQEMLGFMWGSKHRNQDGPVIQTYPTPSANAMNRRYPASRMIQGYTYRHSKQISVQLIWKNRLSSIESVSAFGCTAAQCIISGTEALSPYHHLTSRGQMIVWTGSDSIDLNPDNFWRHVNKYKSRGFRSVVSDKYFATFPFRCLEKRLNSPGSFSFVHTQRRLRGDEIPTISALYRWFETYKDGNRLHCDSIPHSVLQQACTSPFRSKLSKILPDAESLERILMDCRDGDGVHQHSTLHALLANVDEIETENLLYDISNCPYSMDFIPI